MFWGNKIAEILCPIILIEFPFIPLWIVKFFAFEMVHTLTFDHDLFIDNMIHYLSDSDKQMDVFSLFFSYVEISSQNK